jgi:transcriptional regulator with XRE-family HTH domain
MTGVSPADLPEGTGFPLGPNLLRMRQARGLTHRQLAVNAHVSPSWISNVEKGKVTNPGCYLVYRLALALRVPMEELMGVSPLSGRSRINRR